MPYWIMRNIRAFNGHEENDSTHDDELLDNLSPREIVDQWMRYEGMLGYGNRVVDLVFAAFGMEEEDYE